MVPQEDAEEEGTWLGQWAEAMRLSVLALAQCKRSAMDAKTYCLPSLVRDVLTEEDAALVVRAAETAAQREGGYTTRRHFAHPTTDLPVSTIYAHDDVSAIVTAASDRAIRALVDRCGAPDDLTLYDGFVVKYETSRQASLAVHKDGGRYSANVALAAPRESGVRFVEYGRFTSPCRGPDDDFYHTKLCPANCFGDRCDEWLRHGESLDTLQRIWGCDCSLCEEGGGIDASPTFDYEGGGTTFPHVRNVTFWPRRGDAVIHGANQPHGGLAVTSGERYVLTFFFDVPLCRAVERQHFDTFMVSLLAAAVFAAFLYIALVADFETKDDPSSEEAKKKKKKNGKNGSASSSPLPSKKDD